MNYYKLFIEKTNKTLIQFLKYLLVGGIATIVDMGALFSFTHFFHVYYLYSTALAFCLGLITNYILSITWVFESSHNFKKEFALFTLIGIGGLIWNESIMWLLVEGIEIHYMIAKLAAVILVLFWNFFMRKYFCFNN